MYLTVQLNKQHSTYKCIRYFMWEMSIGVSNM